MPSCSASPKRSRTSSSTRTATGRPGEVEIEARRPDGYLCLYVRDSRPRACRRGADSPGLGLRPFVLIGDLSSDFAVRQGANGVGTEVAMRFELDPDAAPLNAPRSGVLT